MTEFFKKVFTKRSLLGTLLLIVLIGEPTVGVATGIFTGPGVVVFFFLYLTLFHIFESVISKYKLVVYQVILLTFAIYAVGVTGLLNKELTEYILKPQDFLIITLIRIQASFFVVFAFLLLNKLIPRDENKVLSIKQSLMFFTVFVSLFSLTGMWGFPSVIFAFKIAPIQTILFSIVAVIALFFALRSKPQVTIYDSKKFLWLIYFCVLMGAIPHLLPFMILLITMIIGGVYLLINKTARNHQL